MKNGWTGGQYSLFRSVFGVYLCVHFAMLLPWGAEVFSNEGFLPDGSLSPLLHAFPNMFAVWDSAAFVTGVLVVATLLSIMLAVGWKDRVAALLLWYIWACLFGRNPLISNPGLPYVGLLLVVHALLPRAPFGSWEARGRVDPAGGWRLAPELFGVVWLLMAVGYSYSGFTKLVSPSWQDGSAMERLLSNPLVRPGGLRPVVAAMPALLLQLATYGALVLELGFLLFACLRRVRPWAWASMLSMHIGLILLIDFADLSLGMVMLHLFTFDPAWIRPRKVAQPETVFYDGSCGLCHRTVRMLLAEDTVAAFHFAPLEGSLFAQVLPPEKRSGLPDSVIVQSADGTLLMRSSGIAHVLIGLGGVWSLLGHALRLLPRPLRDVGYDLIAAYRKRLFARPSDACPLVPTELRERFLLGQAVR